MNLSFNASPDDFIKEIAKIAKSDGHFLASGNGIKVEGKRQKGFGEGIWGRKLSREEVRAYENLGDAFNKCYKKALAILNSPPEHLTDEQVSQFKTNLINILDKLNKINVVQFKSKFKIQQTAIKAIISPKQGSEEERKKDIIDMYLIIEGTFERLAKKYQEESQDEFAEKTNLNSLKELYSNLREAIELESDNVKKNEFISNFRQKIDARLAALNGDFKDGKSYILLDFKASQILEEISKTIQNIDSLLQRTKVANVSHRYSELQKYSKKIQEFEKLVKQLGNLEKLPKLSNLIQKRLKELREKERITRRQFEKLRGQSEELLGIKEQNQYQRQASQKTKQIKTKMENLLKAIQSTPQPTFQELDSFAALAEDLKSQLDILKERFTHSPFQDFHKENRFLLSFADYVYDDIMKFLQLKQKLRGKKIHVVTQGEAQNALLNKPRGSFVIFPEGDGFTLHVIKNSKGDRIVRKSIQLSELSNPKKMVKEILYYDVFSTQTVELAKDGLYGSKEMMQKLLKGRELPPFVVYQEQDEDGKLIEGQLTVEVKLRPPFKTSIKNTFDLLDCDLEDKIIETIKQANEYEKRG